MTERQYRTLDGDSLDLVAHLEYGISSQMTEGLYDHNYRIADRPILMQAGVIVKLPPQEPPGENEVIRLWD